MNSQIYKFILKAIIERGNLGGCLVPKTLMERYLFKNQCKSVKSVSFVFQFHDEFYFFNIYLPFLRSNTWITNPLL